ncbi:DNA-binding protein [Candidatus Desulfarcum epimagneticum]|uniref:DNA-binding protein n=1 Tax=uncultured Desulfobacteraceae bacterium TaxID=218296 RepID=A0A484HD76_9BACT|nr:DNA-binding protein [uncultured Desulfobacteraceae bacterium]
MGTFEGLDQQKPGAGPGHFREWGHSGESILKKLLSTKEVARFLHVNEKMVYALVAEKGLPATKVTGKWLFPGDMVERWIELRTQNYPEPSRRLPPYEGILIIAGSNDPLLDQTLSLYNSIHPDHVAVFGNMGSMGGIQALRRNLCHMASSHLLQENEAEYNFGFASSELERMPAVMNFCRRRQGLIVAAGNPKNIMGIKDLTRPGVALVNRLPGTGTRLLLDHELKKRGLDGRRIKGYDHAVSAHLEAGIAVLSGDADACMGIEAIAGMMGLDFIPVRWERYDLMISRDRFFDEGVQRFVGLLHEPEFKDMAASLKGYDISLGGKMVFDQSGSDPVSAAAPHPNIAKEKI